MKNLLKFFLLSFIFGLQQLFADQTRFNVSSELPLEFNYLVESLQKYELSEEEDKEFSLLIKKLEASLSRLSKEERFFLLKSEIYKSILFSNADKNPDRKNYEPYSLEKLTAQLKVKRHALNSFALWMLLSIHSDLSSLFQNPAYPALKGSTNSGDPNITKEVLRIRRKFDLIFPWYLKFTSMDLEEFHNELKPLLFDTLRRTTSNCSNFILMSRFQEQALNTKSSFFTLQTKDLAAPSHPEIDRLADLVLTNNGGENAPQANTWKPQDSELLPPKIATPSSGYVPPRVLPKPVDEWGGPSTVSSAKGQPRAAATPDPNYIPPKELPQPLNDWIFEF